MSTRLTTVSHAINDHLHLVVRNPDTAAPAKPIEQPTNHIGVIDCSGSMSSDLPKIVTQLTRKLRTLLKEGDTLSLIWFSGRGEFGTLFEAEPVATLADLADVTKAIARWLRPIGLTGFKEPLQEVKQLIGRVLKTKHGRNPFALFFMSDGCDNQWNRADILQAVEQAASGLAASTFVEYGYYADRPLLAAMAAKAGGVHIHAEAFDTYEPVFEAAMQRRPVGGKRLELAITGDPIGGIAWALADGEITAYDVRDGKVFVAPDVDSVYYLSPTPIGAHLDAVMKAPLTTGAAAYAALALFAVRMQPTVVYPILKAIGDVALIDAFAICFGKQKYSEFVMLAKQAAFEPKQRYTKGYDPNKVPADDAFTVLDLLRVLSEDDTTRLLLDDPAFKYSRVSRGRVSADENLSAEEQAQVEEIRTKMAGEKSAKKLKALQAEIDTILASKRDALTFVAEPAPDGYPIASLTYNASRPNVSVLVRKAGTVDLSSRPEHAQFKIPTQFPTHIWRNYTIICDGLVNVEQLPVRISAATRVALGAAGVQYATLPNDVTLINVKPLPIINRQMVKAVSAKTIIEIEWALLQKQAAQKVFKHVKDEKFPGIKLKSFADLYGLEGATWLSEQGLTYGGFAPKTVQAESKDFIIGKELSVKLKGCSTMASVNAVQKKLDEKKKLNPCDQFMVAAMKEAETFLAKSPDKLHEKWLTGKADTAIAETRSLLYQTAQIKFSVIVGQVWFTEFKSLDETALTLKLDGQEVIGTCELREIEIKI